MKGKQYRHILYYSPSHIEQLFFDRVDQATHVQTERETRITQRLMAGLKMFLNMGVEGKRQTRKSVLKSVNHEEDYVQAKKVVNHLLRDETIPRLKNLDHESVQPLYRFSCECHVLPHDEDAPADQNMVEVVGKEGDVKFRGITSLENWSSLSNTMQAVDSDIPYPFDGIVQLGDFNDKVLLEGIDGWELEQADCNVKFVFICQSSREEMQRWYNRQDLQGERYKKQRGAESGTGTPDS